MNVSARMLSCFSHVQLFATLWTAAHQAPLSVGFARQEYWSGVAKPSSRGSSRPRDQTHISCSNCFAGGFFTPERPGKTSVLAMIFWT